MVAILIERRALVTIGCDAADPGVAGFGNRGALARRRVHSLAHVNLDRCLIFVGVFFAPEGFNVAIAVLVNVIDNPGFFLLAFASRPSAFANRHFYPLPFCSMSNKIDFVDKSAGISPGDAKIKRLSAKQGA